MPWREVEQLTRARGSNATSCSATEAQADTVGHHSHLLVISNNSWPPLIPVRDPQFLRLLLARSFVSLGSPASSAHTRHHRHLLLVILRLPSQLDRRSCRVPSCHRRVAAWSRRRRRCEEGVRFRGNGSSEPGSEGSERGGRTRHDPEGGGRRRRVLSEDCPRRFRSWRALGVQQHGTSEIVAYLCLH